MNLLVNALKLVHCRGVPGKRDGRNGKLSCTCGWLPLVGARNQILWRKMSCYQSVLGASETETERKAVERVTGICRIGSGWYVGWLYAAKNVLARKCCGAAGGAAGAPPGKLGSAQDDKEGARQTLWGE